MSRSFDGILRAILTSRVYEVARETSLDVARRLSGRVENTVWLKREDQQPVFSFKIRGAYNRMTRLSASERKVGVITASAGNHAQGVALSAKHLGIRAVIVMPKTTPDIKVEAVRALDAEVVLAGDVANGEANLAMSSVSAAERWFADTGSVVLASTPGPVAPSDETIVATFAEVATNCDWHFGQLVLLGPEFPREQIREYLDAHQLPYEELGASEWAPRIARASSRLMGCPARCRRASSTASVMVRRL